VPGARHGRTRSQSSDDKHHRGGVVWHTQGLRKEPDHLFLVRKVRTVPGLRKTKIVIVTDRNQLQNQVSETLELTGEKVDGPVVCVTIQKQQDPDAMKAQKKAKSNGYKDDIAEGKAPDFPELNANESIVVLIDEAHRSDSSTLHMNLLSVLPNAARIGFTSTPFSWGKRSGPRKWAWTSGVRSNGPSPTSPRAAPAFAWPDPPSGCR
jgi:type I restriction enzyme R subunit